jgi:signal transduction histidine kinase
MSSPGGNPRQPLDLRRVVSEAVGFVRGAGALQPLEVRLREPDRAVAVVGDPVTLGQLFLNLVLNASQAQPGGGEVEVSFQPDGAWIAVLVADRGPGLPRADRERLFEPFFSTRGSTGLGLAVCHGIAAAHGGEIRAQDRPGGGAVFTVRLPLATEPLAADAAVAAADPAAVSR